MKYTLLATIALLSCCVSAQFLGDRASQDKVTSLPDIPAFDFNVYSGYLDIPSSSHSLHYMFAESQGNPQSDPVILWLNGGPGCSSMLGAFTENGFTVNRANQADGWQQNPYSWNKLANILWLESPAGVGYSVAGSSGYKTDDTKSGKENLTALRVFFARFPQFRTNEFYIAGESYAGIYVPILAYMTHQYNFITNGNEKINLKGILVGNGATDWKYDCAPATYTMAFTHAVTSLTLADQWFANKCSVSNGIRKSILGHPAELLLSSGSNEVCDTISSEVNTLMAGINPYNLYAKCEQASGKLGQEIPCLDYSYLTEWFNRADVKAALHVSEKADKWAVCSTNVTDTYQRGAKGSIWAYPTLIDAGIKAWFYSGDSDLAVPYVGSENWLDAHFNTENKWSSWKVGGQIAGFTKQYAGVNFVTVKGAGHMVPQDKPAQAYHIVETYLNGGEL